VAKGLEASMPAAAAMGSSGRRERGLQRWQRIVLTAGAAMGLLLAVSMQYSNTALGRKGRVWGIESLQGVQGVVSMDEAPLLHQAGEYTRGFTLGDESKRLEDEASSQRSRNFPVRLKVPACQCANAHVCAGVFVCFACG